MGACWWGVALVFQVLSRAWQTVPRLVDLGWLHLFGTTLSSAGTAHFALPREVARAGLLRQDGVVPLASWQDTTLYEPLGAHTLACGPPRSHKSWGLCMPVLRTWPGSVIVSDLRHELYDHTAQDRSAFGPVHCYDPAADTSCNLNVLDSVRWGSPAAYGDVMRICHHLIVPQRQREPGRFDRPAVALLTGVVLHLHDLGEASLPAVVDWMLEPRRSQREKLERDAHECQSPCGRRRQACLR